jgi:hypothetical protein
MKKKEKRRRAMAIVEEKRRQATAIVEDKTKQIMVALQSQDLVEFLVSKAEACRYGTNLEISVTMGLYDDAYVRSRSSCNMCYPLLSLFVESVVLAKVIYYSDQQASDPGWDAAGFVRGLDHAALFDLLLAAENLQNRGLLDLTCSTVNGMIHGKSPTEIRAMFGIRPPRTKHGNTITKMLMTPEQKQALLKLEERALRALHAVRCHEFTLYDPKKHGFVYTRYLDIYNFAFFDHYKECECYY